jgi:hypothetical protein
MNAAETNAVNIDQTQDRDADPIHFHNTSLEPPLENVGPAFNDLSPELP